MKTSRWFPLLVGAAGTCVLGVQGGEVQDRILKLAAFVEPAGWSKDEVEFAEEPALRFQSGSREIRIQLFGGEQSRFPTVAAFLASPEARSDGNPQQPPTIEGPANVGGRSIPSYRRSSFRLVGDPGIKFPPAFRVPTEETFVVLPVGDQFIVLKLTTEDSPASTLEARERESVEWIEFLKSFQLKPTSKEK